MYELFQRAFYIDFGGRSQLQILLLLLLLLLLASFGFHLLGKFSAVYVHYAVLVPLNRELLRSCSLSIETFPLSVTVGCKLQCKF